VSVRLSAPSIVLEGLTKVYPDGTRALDGVDLVVPGGAFVGFLGPNGAGKTTTIRILSGALRATAGRALVLGHDPARDPLAVRARIGVLPEEVATYERLTGEELLVFSGRMRGLDRDEAERRTHELLDVLEVEPGDRGGPLIDGSLGLRKKAVLGCALIHGPDLLVLDEPFQGIDAVAAEALRRVLLGLVERGVTVFFSSHVLEVVERLCTRLVVVRDGRIAADGTLAELRERAGSAADAPLGDVFLDLLGRRSGPGGLSWMD
jgi:ABC-2 type transport system ATP-binding protein